MFLGKPRFHRTLKFKIALFYALLFIASCAVGFFILYFFLKYNMISVADARLRDSATEIVCEYFVGKTKIK